MRLFNSIKGSIPNNRFARGVLVLVGGAASGQALILLTSPLITRLYSPQDFGVLAVYSALLAIIVELGSLRYQLAVPLPETDEDAAHVAALSILLNLTTTIITTILIVFFRIQIADTLNTPALANLLWLLPIGILLSSVYQSFRYWALRVKAFSTIAHTRWTQALSMVAIQLLGNPFGALSLVLGQIAGNAVGATRLVLLAMGSNAAAFKKIRFLGILRVANRYRRFPLYSTWAGAFNILGAQLVPLFFAALFNSATVGLYILASRILSAPMTLLGRAIGDVFFSGAADARRTGELPSLVSSAHMRLASISLPPFLFLFILGPNLFAFVFGEEWRIAGEVARWLSPMLYAQFVVSPLSSLFNVLERQAHAVLLQGVLFALRLGALMIGGVVLKDFMVTVMLYGAFSVIGYLAYLISMTRLCRHPSSQIWSPSIKATPIAIAANIPVILAMVLKVEKPLLMAAAAVSVLLVAGFYFRELRLSNAGD